MTTNRLKVESGLQLLARLTKKRTLENFYPELFTNGPNFHEVVELIGDPGTGKSFLLCDMISRALVPEALGGGEAAIIVFNTDGNISLQIICQLLLSKLENNIQTSHQSGVEINCIFKDCLQRLHIIDTYDAAQFYVSIQNLETFLTDYPQISLVILDTLTAYYWSEQTAKITKMSTYLKNTLKLLQRVTKELKVTIMYTRQEYFDSSRDVSDLENINYRILLQKNYNEENTCYEATVVTKDCQLKKYFKIIDSKLTWLT